MTGWDRVIFRICCTVSAVLLFDQAVFAGQFLGGSFGALQTHRDNATAAGIAVLVTAAAGLAVRLRGGPGWPALASLGLFALIALQILLGFRRALTVHIPLGVAIIVLMLLLMGWSWRRPPAAAGGARQGGTARWSLRGADRATEESAALRPDGDKAPAGRPAARR
jgi:hypothetical protein